MVLSMDPNKTIVRKQINAIQFGCVPFCFFFASIVVEIFVSNVDFFFG